MTQPFDCSISTTIARPDADGNEGRYDVIVRYEATIHGRYVPATYWQPAEGPEVEVVFTGAEFDGDEPDDAPGPLTEAEIAGLRAWLDGDGYDEAARRAEEDAPDDGPDPDDAIERAREDRALDAKEERVWEDW